MVRHQSKIPDFLGAVVRETEMSLSGYTVSEIPSSVAMPLIIQNHYLHRRAPCSIAFGLFNRGDLKGVVCYGTPSSAPLRSGIAGPENRFNVCELTRLWVCDSVPRNGESFLIGRSLPFCGKEIVVSFADSSQGHIGYVYQATNWIYTGLSAKRTNWTVEGIDKHCQTIADKYTSAELREQYGDKFTLVDRPRKHRYVFFNCSRTRRKKLMTMLRYPILPYPKTPALTHPA